MYPRHAWQDQTAINAEVNAGNRILHPSRAKQSLPRYPKACLAVPAGFFCPAARPLPIGPACERLLPAPRSLRGCRAEPTRAPAVRTYKRLHAAVNAVLGIGSLPGGRDEDDIARNSLGDHLPNRIFAAHRRSKIEMNRHVQRVLFNLR